VLLEHTFLRVRRRRREEWQEPEHPDAGAGEDVPPSTRVLPCPHNRQRYTPSSRSGHQTYLTTT
jgi:hypothetical protein